MNTKQKLNDIVEQLDESKGTLDNFNYKAILHELLFHGELRFKDYEPFPTDEPDFPQRLLQWIENVACDHDRKILFHILSRIIFIDSKQIKSLYQDAFRSALVPWLTAQHFNLQQLLSPSYNKEIIKLLKKYTLLTITESFNGRFFMSTNGLRGLPKFQTLTEKESTATHTINEICSTSAKKIGIIVFEDIVGTGNQASKILDIIINTIPKEWKCFFSPLIILENGLNNLSKFNNEQFIIHPILKISKKDCVFKIVQKEEKPENNDIRRLVIDTSERVTQQLDEHDTAPINPFGYGGNGCFIVTCHNTPNNTLPLIHHKAPNWNPLFRRLNHGRF